jgi:hypothetical protein
VSATKPDAAVAAERQAVVAEFAAALRQLRLEAGAPSFRAMAGVTGAISHTTLHEAAAGSRLPSWPTTKVYVQACGGSAAEWHRRWLAAANPGVVTADPIPVELPTMVSEPPETAGGASAEPRPRPRRLRALRHLVVLTAGAAIGAGVVLAVDRASGTGAGQVAGTPGYVARIASATGSTDATSTRLAVGHAVAAGDTLVVPMMLTNTHAGAVSATDGQGNTYTVAADQNDGGADDRTLILTATAVKALTSSDTITVSYPVSGEQHLVVEELTDVEAVDQHAAATGGAGTAFNSGSMHSDRPEFVFAVAGVQGGATAAWSSEFTALPTLFVSKDQLATAYRRVGGIYAATGTCDHQWMAAAVAFRLTAVPR